MSEDSDTERRGWQYEEVVKALSRDLKQKRGSGKVGRRRVDEDPVDEMVLIMQGA